MRFRSLLILLTSLAAGPVSADCGAARWKFDMSPAEVAAVTECGPYKTFSNGDLETYNGVFDGQKENFQFFFENGKLRRIGVYLYEGLDAEAGAREWLALHGTLAELFGDVETPGNIAPSSDSAAGAFTVKALEAVRGPGKTQMAPVAQAEDRFVFSSFMRREVEGETHYYVVLYFNRRS